MNVNVKELCVDCFKVVGVKSRYDLVLMLGKAKEGMRVIDIAEKLGLRQPTVTHHLDVLESVDAVRREVRGRETYIFLNRDAHCFEDCHIPFD
jgi:predicted ArsR family transcriptional regulator